MNYRIICVGKIKESFYRNQIEEDLKTIRKHHEIEILEVDDEKTEEHMSDVEREKILRMEGERILQVLGTASGDYIVPLCIDGTLYESGAWKKHIQQLEEWKEYHRITFIIGGSLGLCGDVIRKGHEKVSFSRLTFPHQMMRVLLLEHIKNCCM